MLLNPKIENIIFILHKVTHYTHNPLSVFLSLAIAFTLVYKALSESQAEGDLVAC